MNCFFSMSLYSTLSSQPEKKMTKSTNSLVPAGDIYTSCWYVFSRVFNLQCIESRRSYGNYNDHLGDHNHMATILQYLNHKFGRAPWAPVLVSQYLCPGRCDPGPSRMFWKCQQSRAEASPFFVFV